MTDNYYSGYIKALLDIRDYLDYHSDMLKHNRCYNEKAMISLVDLFIVNRHEIAEQGGMTLELIYNPKTKKFTKTNFK